MEPAGAERHRRESPRGLATGDASQSTFSPSSSNVYKVAASYVALSWSVVRVANRDVSESRLT